MIKDKEVVDTSGELVETIVIEVEVCQKVVPVPRPSPPMSMINIGDLSLC